MSVLVEAHSIIVRCDAIHERYEGGWDRFLAEIPNRTFCSDGEIARVGFMAPSDAEAYVSQLRSRGLRLSQNGVAADLAAAFQTSGLKVPCDWLEFGHVYLDIDRAASVACCRLREGVCMQLVAPAQWQYQGSLSQTYGIFPCASANTGMKFLRHEGGVDVYYDSLAEKEVFVGRTGQ